MAILIGFIVVYLIGLLPAVVVRYVIIKGPVKNRGRFFKTMVFMGYYLALYVVFAVIEYSIAGKITPSIHVLIVSLIGCWIMFRRYEGITNYNNG